MSKKFKKSKRKGGRIEGNGACKLCGKCCLDLVEADDNILYEDDVREWIEFGRDDILAWTRPFIDEDGDKAWKIWVSPRTGRQLDRCPWARKLPNRNSYICRIHDVKPPHCRAFKPRGRVAREIKGRCASSSK